MTGNTTTAGIRRAHVAPFGKRGEEANSDPVKVVGEEVKEESPPKVASLMRPTVFISGKHPAAGNRRAHVAPFGKRGEETNPVVRAAVPEKTSTGLVSEISKVDSVDEKSSETCTAENRVDSVCDGSSSGKDSIREDDRNNFKAALQGFLNDYGSHKRNMEADLGVLFLEHLTSISEKLEVCITKNRLFEIRNHQLEQKVLILERFESRNQELEQTVSRLEKRVKDLERSVSTGIVSSTPSIGGSEAASSVKVVCPKEITESSDGAVSPRNAREEGGEAKPKISVKGTDLVFGKTDGDLELELIAELNRCHNFLFANDMTNDREKIVKRNLKFSAPLFEQSKFAQVTDQCRTLKDGCLHAGKTCQELYKTVKGKSNQSNVTQEYQEQFWRVFSKQFMASNYPVCAKIKESFDLVE